MMHEVEISDKFWNITLRLGSWSGQVKMPKSKFSTAQEAIDQAMQDIITANDHRSAFDRCRGLDQHMEASE